MSLILLFGNLLKSLDMVLVLEHQVVVHVAREILVHVEPHSLVFHILKQVVVIVAVILITVDRNSLDDHAVHYVCVLDV